jgi:hypothetical protein
MYTRHVSIKLRPVASGVQRVLKDKIFSLLRAQRGFPDEITFVAAERDRVIAISFCLLLARLPRMLASAASASSRVSKVRGASLMDRELV